jgi:hypothetical protein
MGTATTLVYKRIAAMLAEKNLLQGYALDQMLPELLPATFHHVPSWFKIHTASLYLP